MNHEATHLQQLGSLLNDPQRPRAERLVRLQGWRDDGAAQAMRAGRALSLGPAVCAAGALAGAWLRSPLLLAVVAGTAAMGAVAKHHPVEAIYNLLAARLGRELMPANRAARRMGCFMGALFLGAAAVAFALGAPQVGLWLAFPLGLLAAFVASTEICVPSIVFTLLFGTERASRPSLLAALSGHRAAPAVRSRLGAVKA